MSDHPRPIVLSSGDPAGIGPELIVQTWSARGRKALPPFAVIGDPALFQAAAAQCGIDLPVAVIAELQIASSVFRDALPILPIRPELAGQYTPGKPNLAGARAALHSLEMACALTMEGEASALVTGPVSKAHLAQIGFPFPGQTEYLAATTGLEAEEAVMMLAGPSLRTVPITIHCPLAQVADTLSSDLIAAKARITAAALQRDFGIANPRLAIAGLNPHAGEDGQFGDEEKRIIAPAIAALKAEGIDANGPYAADALFAPHSRAHYDVALCMYHDQALIPVKALDFDAGVNVTLGLPIIRTSPDHGTAFDIAGTGKARSGALIAAIRMAGDMTTQKGAENTGVVTATNESTARPDLRHG